MNHRRIYLAGGLAALLALLPGCGHAPSPLAPVVSPEAPNAGSPATPDTPATPEAPEAPVTPGAPTATPTQAPTVAPAATTPAAPAATATPTPTVAAAGPGWQTGLSSIPLTLGNSQQALLALVSEQSQPGQVQVSLAKSTAPTAYRALSTTSAAPTGKADMETTLRRLDAKLNGVKAQHRYRVQDTAPRQVGDTEPFWVIASSDSTGVVDHAITARTVYAGAHCDVLVDAADGTAIDDHARAMGETFDQHIYATDTRLFGEPLPVGARGGHVTIVVTPEVGNHGQDGTLGYFTARDLFAPSDAPDSTFLQHSNQGANLYMADRVVANGQPIDYLGTLAHEFQHLISGTYKLYGPASRQEDVWLNESMSMYAMVANGYGLQDGSRVIASHVANYLAAPDRYSLTRWDLDPEQSAYGAGYLFMTYFVERAGEEALKALVSSSATGTANLDAVLAAKGLTFKQLFRDWTAATMLDGSGYGAPYEYGTLDLHGTYAGRTFKGPTMAAVDLPNAGQVPTLPYSASYLLLRGTAGGSFTLDVAGQSADDLGAFLLPR